MTVESSGPPRARLRRLSAEEIELWLSVAAGVTRRIGSALPARAPAEEPAASRVPPQPSSPGPAAKPAGRGRPPAGPPAPPLAPLERKLKQRLSRGRATADAAIDLHGFRQGEAHGALLRFLQRAQRDGLKVVLVVTGKGGRRPDEANGGYEGRDIGVLKRAVPLWLSEPAFRATVVGYEEAGRSHGGAGALYVRVRKGVAAPPTR